MDFSTFHPAKGQIKALLIHPRYHILPQPCLSESLLPIWQRFPADSHCPSWLVTRKRRWRTAGGGGGGERRLIKNTEEEGRRLVGETEKQATCVCCPDLVSLLFSSAAAPLHHPPTAPAVRHLSDINLIFSRLIFPPISSSSSLSVSLLFCVYEVNPPKQPAI